MRKGRIFKNRYLLGTMLGGAMLFAAAGSSYSQDGKILQPVGNWAVSKLASSSATGQDYCAMARRFDQNKIITFAQNAGDKSSLAIDLQQNILDRSQSYDVTITAGSFETRKQTLRPVSQSAFVMKLGKDPVFYDALKNSGQLNVSFSDTALSFGMQDFAQGQVELGGCLASLEGPSASVASTSSATTSQPVSKSSVSSAATSRSASYVDPGIVDSLRQENTRLRTALETERREYETRFMEEASTSRASELTEKISLLERQNANLQKRLASAGIDGAVSSDVAMNDKVAAELEALRQENITYKQQVSALEDKIQKIAASAPATDGPQDITAGEMSKAPASQMQEQQLAALNSRVSELTSSVGERDKQIEILQSALKEAQASASTPVSAGSAQKELMELKSALKQKDEEIWQLNSKLLAGTAKGGAATVGTAGKLVPSAPSLSDAQVKEYENKISMLEQSLAAAQAGQGAAQSGNEAITQYAEQIATLQTKLAEKDKVINDLGGQIKMAEDQKATSGDLQQRVATLTQELQKLKDEKTALEQSHQSAMAQQQAQLAALNEQLTKSAGKEDVLAQKDAQVQSLTKDLNSTQALVKQMETDYQTRLAEMQSRLDSQSLQLEAAEQERLDLVKQAQSTEQQIIKELELQLTNLKLENTRLKEENDTAIDDTAAAHALESLTDFKAIEAELSSVLRERNDLAAKVETMEDALRNERMSASGENWDLQKATTRFSEAERQIKRLGQQMEKSRSQCEIDKKELEYKLFDPKIAESEQTVKLITLERELASAKEALRGVDARYQSQITELENELRHRAEIPAVSPEAQAEIASLKKQLQSAQSLLQQKDERYRAQLASMHQQSARVTQAAAQPAVSRPVQQARVQSQPVSLAPTPAPVAARNINTSPQSYDDFASAASFSKLLQSNGVDLSTPVQTLAGGNAQVMRYSWRSGQVDGNAEQHSINSPRQYDQVLDAYIKAQKTKCRGDFAAVPVADKKAGTMRVSSYDLACVGAGRDSTSSVVFYNTDDVFTSIAHDAGLDNMDIAMDVRDRIASGILNGRIAY